MQSEKQSRSVGGGSPQNKKQIPIFPHSRKKNHRALKHYDRMNRKMAYTIRNMLTNRKRKLYESVREV